MSVARARAAALPGVLWRSMRGIGRMSPTDRREYTLAVLLALGSEIGLRTLPLPRLARLYGVTFRPGVEGGRLEGDTIDLPRWAVHRLRVVATVMRRWPVDGECLRQSLVAGHRLRSFEPALKVGVAREDGRFVAHAWLEIDGFSLDPSSTKYEPLPIPES